MENFAGVLLGEKSKENARARGVLTFVCGKNVHIYVGKCTEDPGRIPSMLGMLGASRAGTWEAGGHQRKGDLFFTEYLLWIEL